MLHSLVLRSIFICSVAVAVSARADAATWYWDTTGTTYGFGTASGTWGGTQGTVNFFSESDLGTATTVSSTGSTVADTLWFGTDTLGLASGSITVSGSRSIGTLIFGGSSGVLTLASGTIALATSGTIAVNNASATISSRLTGSAASLTKTGTGTLSLTGPSDYAGGTTILSGRIVAGSLNALGSGSGGLTLLGGTLELSASSLNVGMLSGSVGSVVTSSTATGTRMLTTTISSGMSTFEGSIVESGSGVVALTKSGAGTLILSGSNAYTGGTTINSGTLVVGNAAALGGDTARIAVNGGLLDTGTFSMSFGGMSGYGVITTGSAAGTRSLTVTIKSATSSIFNGAIRNNGTGVLALVKSGSGGLTLSSSSSYTGGTTITGGTLTVGNVAALGGSVGRLAITGGVLNTGSTGVAIGSLSGGSGGVITTATSAGTRILTTTGVGSSTYNGTVQDNGAGKVALTVNGGSLTLTGSSSYSGGTTLTSGTLTLGHQSALGAATGNLTVNGGRLVTGLYSPSVGALSGSRGVITTAAVAGTRTLTTSVSAGISIFTGTLADSAPGVLALAKTGAGTLVLGVGGSSTFTGGATVEAGTLRVDGWAGASAVAVNAGATLAGSGTTGAVSVGPGGSVSPGNGVGKLNVGAVTLAGGGNYNWQLANASGAAGAGWDLLSGSSLTVNSTVSNPFSINLWTGTSATAVVGGAATNFDQSSSYAWTIGTFSGGISGFAPGLFSIVTGPANGTGGFANTYTGAFSLTSSGTDLTLVYTPVAVPNPDYVGGTGLWSTAANWSPAIVPTASPPLTFSGAGGVATNDGVLTAVSGVRFAASAGGYTVAGSGLSIGADGITNESAATQTMQTALTLVADSRLDANGGALVMTGSINTAAGRTLSVRGSADTTLAAVSGAGGIVKLGTGLLTLSGSSEYSGGTTLSSGTILVASASALGAASGPLTVNGGVLDLAGYDAAVGILSGSGAGVVTTSVGPSRLTTSVASGSFSFGGGLRDGAAGTLALVKSGPGQLVLSGSNSHSGGTTVTEGSLVVASAAALGTATAPLAVIGGTLDTGTFGITVGALSGSVGGVITTSTLFGTRALTVNANTDSTFAGILTGTGSGQLALVKSGVGSLVLSASNRHTGGTTINAGTLVMGNVGALGTGTVGVMLNGGTLDTGTFSPVIGGLSGAAGTVVTTASTAGTRNLWVNVAGGTSTFAGSIRDNGAGVLSLTKSLAGGLILAGSNAYSGSTSINAGTLTVGNAAALGGASARVGVNGGALDTGTFSLTVASLTGFGAVTTAAAPGIRTLTISSTSTFTFGGSLRDNGPGILALVKQGTGRLNLSGSNSLTGGITVQGGTLAVGQGGWSGSLGSGAVINDAALVFDRSDAYGGPVGNTINGSGSLTLNRGSLTLSGSNGYAGGTIIASGTLAFGNRSAFGTGPVTVRNGAALGGSGTVDVSSLVFGSGTGVGQAAIAMSVAGGAPATRLNILGDIITTGGTNSVVFSFGKSLATLSSGIYTLASYGGSLGDFSAFGYSGTAGPRQSLQLVNADHEIDLAVSNAGVIWSGANGNGWATPDNWTLSTDGTPATFLPSDNVVFDDSGVQSTVTITSPVAPSTITVAAGTRWYWISNSGSGAITAGALVKSGAGMLVVDGSNSFAGGTTLNEGELRVGGFGTSFALGKGMITITGGTLGSANEFGKTLANPVSLQGDFTLGSQGFGSPTLSGTIDLEGGTRQVTVAAWNGTISGRIVDGGLIKSGSLTLTLSGSNTYAGDTRVASGTLALANTSALAGSTLDMAATDTGSIAFAASGTVPLAYSLGGLKGSRDIALGSATLRVGGNGQSTTFAGAISGSGGLVKVGGGSLTLTGPNTYSGTTTVGAGRLVGTTTSLRGAVAVTSGTLEFSQAASGTFAGTLSGFGTLVKSNTGTLVLTGTSVFNGPTIVAEGRLKGTTASLGGSITNRAELEFDQAASGVFSGVLSGTGALIKSGLGSLTLMPNSVVGNVQVNAGTLVGATVNFGGGITTSGTVVFSQATNGEYAGVINGSGLLVKTGTGMLVLSGSNTLTGTTSIQQGLLATASAERISDAATVSISTMAGLRLGGNETIARLVGSGTVDLQSYQLTVAGSGSSSYGGSIVGSGGLTKAGVGTLTLTGSSSFLGTTNLVSGRLMVSSSTALSPYTTLTIGTSGTLVLNSTVRVFSYTNGGTISGSGSLLTSATTVTSGTIATPIANVTGTGGYAVGLEKNTTGTVVVTASNSFTGGIVVSAGTMQLASGGGFAPGNVLEVRSGAALELQGQSQTFAALAGDGSVTLGNATITVDATTNTNFSGTLIDGSLVKTGASSLTLAGFATLNEATVSGGLLSVNGTLAADVVVDAGGVLGGGGTIVGDLTVSGTQNPGNSPGIATVQGNATYTAGSTVVWELAGNTESNVPLIFDQISVVGDLAFTGPTAIQLSFYDNDPATTWTSVVDWSTSFWDSDHSWVIFDVTGVTNGFDYLSIAPGVWLDSTDPGVAFATARPDASFSLMLYGSDVVLAYAAVPEPATLVPVLVGLAYLACTMRVRGRSRRVARAVASWPRPGSCSSGPLAGVGTATTRPSPAPPCWPGRTASRRS